MIKTTNDGFFMLVNAVYFRGKQIGYISSEGIEWGGSDAEYSEVFAAQVRNAPVLKMKKKDATNQLGFKLIELRPLNCVDVMGGKVTPDGEGYEAPYESMQLCGELKILTGTGQTITMANGTLDTAVRGTIGGDTPLYMSCKYLFVKPEGDVSPFTFEPTKPFITAESQTLDFVKAGGEKIVHLQASGKFAMGVVPAGFTAKVVGGRLIVVASKNDTTSIRTGKIKFTLIDDPTKTVEITVNQAG